MHGKLSYVINKLKSNDNQWFEDNGIVVKEKGDYWVLNYHQFAPKNEYNVLTRGLVIDKSGAIASCPFFRFFNYGEPTAAEVNFSASEILEKLDGCFDCNTTISFCDGSYHRIKDVVDNKLTGPVWGYDHQAEKIVETNITHWHNNGRSDEWLTIHINDPHNGNHKKCITCTPNHKFSTPNGYVSANELKTGDTLYEFNLELTPIQQSLILGTLLGDSSIVDNGAINLQWSHCHEQEALSKLKCRVLMPLPYSTYSRQVSEGGFSKNPGNHYKISGSKLLTPIYNICYKDGKKTITENWLNQVNDIALAIWFQDDGSMSKGDAEKQRPRAIFHTEGFSDEENESLIKWLQCAFGILAVKQQYRGYTCLRLNAEHAEILWKRIAYFVIPELRYKLPEEYRNFPCFWDCYQEETLNNKMRAVKVLKVTPGNKRISKHSKRAIKYDITTTTHNFFAKKILVHNSMVGVFFPKGDVDNPVWHFRSLLSAHQKDREFAIKGFVLGDESPLLMEVEPYLKQINFKRAIAYDMRYFSLTFEFISRANAVITKYDADQYGLYLIGARYVPTLYELDEEALDVLARVIGVRRPRRWAADSYDQVLAMMADFPKDYEGFVVRDRATGARIKIKSEDYLRRHRLLTKLNYKNLIPLWFQGESGEIEAYFPQTKTIFDEITSCNENFTQQALDVLTYWQKANVSRKEVALGIVGKEPRHICSIVFKLIDEKEDQQQKVKKLVSEMRVETLIEAWGLKDDLVEEVVSEIIA
jgi:hypothetical protein